MRKAAGYFAILMSVALLLLASAGANPALAWDNATAGIVKDTGSGSAICTFHIQGSQWDKNATGTWDIKQGTTLKASGTWTGNASGSFTASVSGQPFANGSYRLHVRQSTPNAGGDITKDFTVNCATSGGSTGSGGTTGSTSGGTTSTSTSTSGGAVCHKSGNDMITWHSAISGASEGGTASVSFTVAENCTVQVSFVSYTAPSAEFDENTANQQRVFDFVTTTFTGGTHTLTVRVPSCFFQIDFVRGTVITQLGPAGSNNFYGAQGRLIAGVTGGSHKCTSGTTSTSTGTTGSTSTSTGTTTGTSTSTGTTGSTSTSTGTTTGTSTSSTTGGSTTTTGATTGATTGTTTTTTTGATTGATTGGTTGSTSGGSTSTTSGGTTGSTSTAGAILGVQNLPSTGTDSHDRSPLVLFGFMLMAIGGGLLRWKPASQVN